VRVLDLFCGGGGAAMGLHQAWPDAEIVGVDIKPQPRYPFTFVQADAMTYPLEGFDFIWASPPCQAWSSMQRANVMRKDHPQLINTTRSRLAASGVAWTIENVPEAPLLNPVTLCGLSFGLRVLRHRNFESSFPILPLAHKKHQRQPKVRGKTSQDYLDGLAHIGFTTGSNIAAFRDAMGCPWMTTTEARQAIPPAYSRYIAEQYSQSLVVAAGGNTISS